ncbi:periplasmic nitrate reductase, NapE protein (plasmid) [Nitrobacteraceae bacterium UC4446_H13]
MPHWRLEVSPAVSDDILPTNDAPQNSLREEFVAFFILAVLIWPFAAFGTVGGYGFLVWMYQIVFGPPGPPH